MAPTLVTFTVTGAPQRLSATHQSAAKIFIVMLKGGSGVGYVGLAALDASGNNRIKTLDAASATIDGGSFSIETQDGWNGENVEDYYIHGANAGDKIAVTYQTA